MTPVTPPVVPSGWVWRPLDSLAEVSVSSVDKKSYDGEKPVRLCNYTDVYYNDQITDDIEFMEATATAEQYSAFAVRAGDVVITKDSESSDDVGRPAYVPLDLPGVVYGYHLAVYRPYDLRYSRFLTYLFDSNWVRAQFELRTPGVTRIGLNRDTLRNLKVPVPSPQTAEKIADHLDREIVEIDEAISDQLTVARLLKERNDAHITSAVTPSGETNARELVRLKRIADLIGGLTYEPSDIVPDSRSGTLVVRAGNVQHGELIVRDPVYVRKAIPETLRLRHDDIVVCARSGSAELVGKNALVTEEFVGETWGAFMMVVRSNFNPYLRWVLSSRLFSEQAGSYATTTINQLTVGTLGDIEFWLPPLEVQVAIDRELRKAVETNKQVMSDIQRAISLAKERRAAIITAAVTGQIDVTAKNKPVAEQLEDELAEAR